MVFQNIKRLLQIDKKLSLFVVSTTAAVLYISFGMYAILDTFYLLFLVISLLLLLSPDKYEKLIRYSSHYFIYYFTTRSIFIICISFHAYKGGTIPKIISSHINIFNSWIIVTALFLFILLFYWQIVTKGLVRYGEIVARFYLDALPGQQNSIDSEKRDGVISSRKATLERKRILEKSVQLGSLDACMKLTVGNFFLISFSTLLYFIIRMYVVGAATTGGITSEVIFQSLAEASVYGFLITVDAILFLLPLVAALGKANAADTGTKISSESSYNFIQVMLLFFIFFFIYAYVSDTIFWESFLVISGVYLVLYQYNRKDEEYSQFFLLINNLSTVVVEPAAQADKYFVPVIEVPLHIIRQTEYGTLENFADLVSREFCKLSYFNLDKLLLKITTSERLVVRYPDGSIDESVVPQRYLPVDLPIHVMKLFYPNCITADHDSCRLFSWIPENVFKDYYADNPFMVGKLKEHPAVIAQILCYLLKRYQKKMMTADELFNYIHTCQLEKAESIYSIDILKEVGYRRVLEVSNDLNKIGLDGFDVKTIIQSVVADDESEIKNYVNYKMSEDLHYLSAADAEVRVVMISDKTFDKIEEEYHDANDVTTSIFYGDTLGKIKELLSILSFRGLSPLLVLLPDTDTEWVRDLFYDLDQLPGKVILLERTLLPKGLKFQPLKSI
jgi:hypothetical protein